VKIKNLFGEIVEAEPKIKIRQSIYQRFKFYNNYRKCDGLVKCGNCKHHKAFAYHNKIYHKCELLGISNSEATDIRVSSVCDKWEK
jgi:hypothetical protein